MELSSVLIVSAIVMMGLAAIFALGMFVGYRMRQNDEHADQR